MKKNDIGEYLLNAKKVAITGHISPDGDCVGACLALRNYILDNYEGIEADVYMQRPQDIFDYLKGSQEIKTEYKGERYDLFVLLDISAANRVAVCGDIFETGTKTLCIDHHRTNPGGFTWTFNDPLASSTCEVLYRFLDDERISRECAECLYTGIVHDTGVFQYSCTSPETMRIAAKLMEKGLNFTKIIDESFFQKSFIQNKALGEVLCQAQLYLDGLVVASTISRKKRHEMGLTQGDLDGVVATLRNTREADTALFIYQLDDGMFKISCRSRAIVDVSSLCQQFGGGGHVRAAGAKMEGSYEEILDRLLAAIEEQIEGA